MSRPIPDRWLKYAPIGKRIEGTRFIAFKVPLREHVVKWIDYETRLDINSLLSKVPNLGIIIDLTNTDRYYDPELFRRKGVEHKKLMIPGHATPPNNLVNQFKLYVMSFLKNNKDNDKLIGVHCTHGVNRTGYLICNYMISEMNIDPKEAIKKFDAARGHGIERNNYLEALANLLNSKSKSDEINKTYKSHHRDSGVIRDFRNDTDMNSRNSRHVHEFIDENWRYRTHRNHSYHSPYPTRSAHGCNENWRSSFSGHGDKSHRDNGINSVNANRSSYNNYGRIDRYNAIKGNHHSRDRDRCSRDYL